MKLLKIGFSLIKNNDIYIIKDDIKNESVFAFKVPNNVGFNDIKTILYNGQKANSNNILFNKNNLFITIKDSRKINAYREIRNETEIIKDKFINNKYYEQFLINVDNYVKNNFVFTISKNIKSNILNKALDNFMPEYGFSICNDNICDFSINDLVDNQNDALYILVTDHTIFIGLRAAMLKSVKLKEYEQSISISILEKSFLNFIINKIIFAYCFKLYETNTSVQYYPIRQYIKFDRSTLTMSMVDY